jgi:hypothetical protein
MAMVFFVSSESERLDFDAVAAMDQESELRAICISWNNLTFQRIEEKRHWSPEETMNASSTAKERKYSSLCSFIKARMVRNRNDYVFGVAREGVHCRCISPDVHVRRAGCNGITDFRNGHTSIFRSDQPPPLSSPVRSQRSLRTTDVLPGQLGDGHAPNTTV